MALITADDLRETYSKLKQRGLSFLLSKFNVNAQSRTRSAFNEADFEAANWWMIPAVKSRWNKLITGSPDKDYEDYVVETCFSQLRGLNMLSIGCGEANHEIRFAQSGVFDEVWAIDISDKLIAKAKEKAQALGLQNTRFETADIYKLSLPPESLDAVLFHSSLHHFPHVEAFMRDRILPALKPGGYVILHEYVGPDRLQLSGEQVRLTNEWLQVIPGKYRKRYKTGKIKNSISGPGRLRMIIADPSEAVDSSRIIPVLHQSMQVKEEKVFGTVMMMLLLKDIAHHFCTGDEQTQQILGSLFAKEDQYIQKNQSGDFVFGVYQKVKVKG